MYIVVPKRPSSASKETLTMTNTVTDPHVNQRVPRKTNPWGVVALVAALISFPIRYLWLNSLVVFEVLSSGSNMYVFVVAIHIVKYLPHAALLLGVVGFLLAMGRSRRSSIAAVALACACFAMVFCISRVHANRAESFKRITSLIGEYSHAHNAFPKTLSGLPSLTADDQELVTYIPGASKDEKVQWKQKWSGFTSDVESYRMVCFLRKITFGDRYVFLADGKIYTMSRSDEFEQILTASK